MMMMMMMIMMMMMMMMMMMSDLPDVEEKGPKGQEEGEGSYGPHQHHQAVLQGDVWVLRGIQLIKRQLSYTFQFLLGDIFLKQFAKEFTARKPYIIYKA